ncbi:MAG TPA: choice-of-anchor J domain-containing protein, partial [Chryseolinea sp.]|nr:choice-of-anchor J domain-containing protein [Chryseolinea sp.]
YDNNRAVSNSSMTVDAYTAQFVLSPTVTSIMNSSFVLSYPADGHLYHCYYRYQFGGTPAPDANSMKSSADLLADAPLTISYLSPAQAYDVYFMGEARDGNVTDILKVPVTTPGTSSPTVLTSDDQITLFPAGIGAESITSLLSVYGFHLAGPVVASGSQGFVVSLDNVTYAEEVSIPANSFNGGTRQSVFVKAQPFDSRGNKSGTCTFSTTGASNLVIDLGVVVYSHYDTDFEGVNSIDETGWISYSVSGDQVWNLVDLEETSVNQRTTGGNMAMQIDGTGGAALNEDWFISPDINLSSFTQTPALRFRAYSSGDGEPLILMYSADYPGFGDPRNSTWFDTKATFPSVNSKSWKNIMVPLLGQGEHLRFAFVYRSTELKGSRWSIDDWRITDNLVNIPDGKIVFEDVSVGKASDPQSMLVSVAGFGSVTITASDDFQVSSDGIVFSPAVVVPEADIATGVALRLRYFPQEFIEEKQGTLTFSAGNNFLVVRDILIGRTSLTTAIEERTTLTGFLYPNPTSGDVHVDLSALQNPDTTYPVVVANSIGVSVAVLNASSYTLEQTLSGIFTNLESGIYFVIIKGKSTTWRTKLIRK